jgi:HAD superfamily hydrolase (TIGR01484 family)
VKPIATLPAETALALEGICFDIDDTVTTHGTLDVAAYAALVELKRAGLKLVAVTGRPLGFAEVVARTWAVDAAVGENGAGYVAREGKGLRFGYWDDEVTRAEQAQALSALRELVGREMPGVKLSSDSWARRCDLAFDVGEHVSLPRRDIDRLAKLLASEGAHVTVSTVHAHAQLGEHDKASGLALAARELFGWDAEQTRERFAFVGDSGNDAAAFAWFDVSIGVANVRAFLDRLPVPPRYVSDASHGAGFAEIARVLLEKRRGA